MDKYVEVDSVEFGLSKRQKLVRLSSGNLGIVKMRKSRLIMKDGKQILDMANVLTSKDAKLKVSLIISGPICSKTVKYLTENDIDIVAL
ncbi:MAG: hypothetical protein GXO88_01640 [Chlorobi bacterium]|nr:hypothetical protein [Chlorobiota bacterium]